MTAETYNILILAIAGFITIQIPAIIGIIKIIVEAKYSRTRQYHIINQNNELLKQDKEHIMPNDKNIQDKDFR